MSRLPGLLLLVLAGLMAGCYYAKSVDIERKLTLENARDWIPEVYRRYEILDCSGTVRIQGRYFGVPSPSDTQYFTTGSVVLSPESWRKMKLEAGWAPPDKDAARWIPIEARDEDLLTSTALNEALRENELFGLGVVYFDPGDNANRRLRFAGQDFK